jgi:Tfp pilus assembly protein PilF
MEIGIIILGILLLAVLIVFRTRMIDEMRRSQSNRYMQPTYQRPAQKPKTSPLQAMLDKVNEAIHKQPKSAAGYSDRGAVLIVMKRYDEAMVDLNRALELQPNTADTLNNRAVAHYRQHNFQLAFSDLNSAITHAPDEPYTHLNRAMVHKKLDDNLKAETDIETALDLSLKLVDVADKANHKQHVLDENIIWNRQLARMVFEKTELLLVQYEHREYLDNTTP